MGEVKRYSLIESEGSMNYHLSLEEHEDGGLVEHADYQKLEEENKELKEREVDYLEMMLNQAKTIKRLQKPSD